MEFGPRCDHSVQGEPIYRFHLVMCDALHGGPPLTAQLWETANILLQTTPSDFSKLNYVDQMLKVHGILCKAPKVWFNLYVKDFEVRIQHITPVCDVAPMCPSPSLVSHLPHLERTSKTRQDQRMWRNFLPDFAKCWMQVTWRIRAMLHTKYFCDCSKKIVLWSS